MKLQDLLDMKLNPECELYLETAGADSLIGVTSIHFNRDKFEENEEEFIVFK